MSTGSSPPGHDGGGSGAHGIFGSSGISGFGYGIGISIGILLIVSTIALAVYFCTRTSMPVATTAAAFFVPPPRARRGGDVEQGIDEATLEAFPAVAYAEARKAPSPRGRDAAAQACCPVCLENYADADMVRALPDCAHLFHRECVDPWLRLRPTCPVCRTSPLPSPLPTPLAEVTPLASARQ